MKMDSLGFAVLQRLGRALPVAAEHLRAPPVADVPGPAGPAPAMRSDSAPPPRELARPAPHGQGIRLDFLSAKPCFAAGSRVAAQWQGGVLSVSAHPPMQAPVGGGLAAHVERLTLDAAGQGAVQGWLRAWGAPVVSVSLLPQSWWHDGQGSGAVMDNVWASLVPSDAEGTRPPDALTLRGVVEGDRLRLRARGHWGDAAHVRQDLELTGAGDVLAGMGGLRFFGPLPALSRFVDSQLLPLTGAASRAYGHALPADPHAPVRATACWGPTAQGAGWQLRAGMNHPDWQLRGYLNQDGDTLGFVVDFDGCLECFAQAADAVRLPSLCGVDDLAPWTRLSCAAGRAWSGAAWQQARGRLHVEGTYTPARGAEGVARLWLRHGNWVDAFEGRLGAPQLTPVERTWPHLVDEAGPLELPPLPSLRPAMHALDSAARFATGRRVAWNREASRPWGMPWPDNLSLTLRRHAASAWALLPASAAHSLMSLWRTLQAAPSPAEPAGFETWSISA